MSKANNKSKKSNKKSVNKTKKTLKKVPNKPNLLYKDYREDYYEDAKGGFVTSDDYNYITPSSSISSLTVSEELPKAPEVEAKKPWWRFW